MAVAAVLFSGCSVGRKSINHGRGHRQTIVFDRSVGKMKILIMEEAVTWMGTPYRYAACDKGKGTDCSGMVMKVYEDVTGLKLPRNSARQAEFCERLDAESVEPGDLVFFATGKDPGRISHVGIMLDADRFIHASTSKGVVVSSVSSPYYIRTFRMYGRVPRFSGR